MNYLTYAEMVEIVGDDRVSEVDYKKYQKRACDALDSVTNNFYHFCDISKDYAFRSGKFKEALAAQIVYFSEMGGDTYEAINKAPQSFSVGRTNVSNGSRYNAGGENESKKLVSEDVYLYLEGTGLLFRGGGCL